MVGLSRIGLFGAVVAWGAVALTACGTSESASTIRRAPSAPAAARTREIDGAVLLRHDLPPSGVRRQVSYVGGAGPLGCETPHQHSPRLSLYEELNPPRNDRRIEVGGQLVVCTDGFAPRAPVDVTVTGPARRTLRAVAPGGPDVAYYRGVTIELLPGTPPGRYRVVATQGRAVGRAAFTLVAADLLALHVVRQPRRGDAALIVAVGLPRDAMVRAYRMGTSASADGIVHSRYVASFPATPARDGTSIMRISTDARAPGGCWWLVVAARGETSSAQLCVG